MRTCVSPVSHGRYLYLMAVEIPVAEFKMEVLSVSLVYHDNLLRTAEVIAVIVFGTLGNIVIFGLMASTMAAIKAMGIRIPQLLSLATFAYVPRATYHVPRVYVLRVCVLRVACPGTRARTRPVTRNPGPRSYLDPVGLPTRTPHGGASYVRISKRNGNWPPVTLIALALVCRYGIMTVLDPILMFLQDCVCVNNTGHGPPVTGRGTAGVGSGMPWFR